MPTQTEEHYNRVSGETRKQREESVVINLRRLNNSVKRLLIQEYGRVGRRVLDLACGRGGDLFKFRGVTYVGVDSAAKAIDEAKNRAANAIDEEKRRAAKAVDEAKKRAVECRDRTCATFYVADCFTRELPSEVVEKGPFDVCNCQFAVHYSWSSEETARQTLKNISSLLRPGGMFIGSTVDSRVVLENVRNGSKDSATISNRFYTIAFEESISPEEKERFGMKYHFKLCGLTDSDEGLVNCAEYLVFFELWKRIAREYDLELVMHVNFEDFLRKKGRNLEDFRRLSADEAEVFRLYCVFAFKKSSANVEKPQQKERKRNHPYDSGSYRNTKSRSKQH